MLNPNQHSAITHPQGPLLIIAGAGTGKTRVITERILHLIKKEKISPANILALTFTEKSAQEMIERIDLKMPLGYEETWIKTFHGFCDAVLREKGLEIGLSPDYKILSQTDQWLFLKKRLFQLDLDYYRPLGNPTKFISALITHFNRLQDEDIQPAAYLKYAMSFLRKQGSNSPPIDPALQEESAKHLELANAFQKYQDLKIAENKLDFADLQYFTLRLLENRPSVLQEFQKRFPYILIDEFQDTNFAQNKIIELLAQKHQNITVVGDDDQSIYKWRGASLTNILNFEKTFPTCKKIVLTENYRSTPNILEASYQVIQNNNPNRLEIQEKIDKKLVARAKTDQNSPTTNPKIKVINAHTYLEEIQTIINQIHTLTQKKEAEFKDIAILVRANSHAKSFIEEFKRQNIPYHFFGSQGLFSREEIKDLIALLKFLGNLSDDIALFRLLCLPIFEIKMENNLNLLTKAKKENKPLFSILKNENAVPSLLPTAADKYQEIHKILDQLIELSREKPVSRILGEFIRETNYLKTLEKNETAENYEKIQNISRFSRRITDFEAEHTENKVLDFLEYLEIMENAPDAPIETSETLNDLNRVKILTLHSSKGLEFPYVFLVNLVNQRFPAVNRREPFQIPEELLQEKLPTKESNLPEERRLFYVGCTRAQKQLFLTWSEYYESGRKKWKKSIFIDELEKSGLTENLPVTQKIELKTEIPITPTTQPLKYVLNLRRLSYSQIDSFQTCPLKYKFQYLYKLPSPPSAATSFGSTIHNTLNEFYLHLKKDPEKFNRDSKTNPKLLKELYEKNWLPYGFDNPAHEKIRQTKGWEMLKTFYQTNSKPKWTIPAYLERNFSLKIGPKLSIIGRIDRIDKLPDGTYEVIDYKTGKLKDEKTVAKDLQLSIYALACQNIFRLPISKLSFYFLEDNQKIETTRQPTKLIQTEKDLLNLHTEISQSKFPAKPGFLCQFCPYRLVCYAV